MSEDRAPYVAGEGQPKNILSRVFVVQSNDPSDLRGKLQNCLDLAGYGFRLVSMTQSQTGFLITVVAVVQREEL